MNAFNLKDQGLAVVEAHHNLPSSSLYDQSRCFVFSSLTALASAGAWLSVVGWLAGGCAAPGDKSTAPKPGQGIVEYRQVGLDAHRAVATVVKSLEALARPSTRTAAPHSALAGFDRAFNQLELTSVKARARAEAIIARGQAYFDEWKEHLAGVSDEAAAQAETQRYTRLFDHFGRVRQRSGEVREEFRPFMAKLREFRARLDRTHGVVEGEASREELDGLMASGRRVLQTLESVSAALDEAEAELHATRTASR